MGSGTKAVLSIHHCLSVAVHEAQRICTDYSPGQQTSSGTGSRHTVFPPQHPQAVLHIHVHLQAVNSHTQASSSTPHGRNNFHSSVPCMLQKRLPGTVTPDSLALPLPSMRPQTVLGPEINTQSQTFAAIRLLGLTST